MSHFDPDSDYHDFRGFFVLFWIGLAIMVITAMLRNYKDTGYPLSIRQWDLFTEKVYELRSYEAPSEKLYWNKVDMFNKGDEIGLFKRLGFNAVFYGEVLAGSHMPNLMYMTSFENMNDRNEHWKTFGNDPQWKKLLADPTYLKGNVSRNDTWLMKATAYSEL